MKITEKIDEKIEIYNGKDIDNKMLFMNGFEFPNVKYIKVDKIDRDIRLYIDPWPCAASITFEFIDSMRMTVWNNDLKDVLIQF